MARQSVRNADLEIDVALQLMIRVRELWTAPWDGRVLSLEEMATNRLARRLQSFANDLLEGTEEPTQDLCVKVNRPEDMLNGNGAPLEYASRD